MMVRRQCSKVSMRPASGSTRSGSWYSHPGWFSSEPRWWSIESTTAPVASAAAPRYTVDFPHQAPISTKVGGDGSRASSARPARRAARYSASPSSSGMKPRVRRAVSKQGLHPLGPSPPAAGAARHQAVGVAAARSDVGQPGTLAGGEGDVDPQPLNRLGHPAWARRQRVVVQEGDRTLGEVGVGAQCGDRLEDAGGAFFGNRSRMASHVLGDARPDGLVARRDWPAARR